MNPKHPLYFGDQQVHKLCTVCYQFSMKQAATHIKLTEPVSNSEPDKHALVF